ncbi:MAG: phospholipase [Gammaproteobacteria bacterium]|nr:phospholipase [Gammaproteobacteria bacterium]
MNEIRLIYFRLLIATMLGLLAACSYAPRKEMPAHPMYIKAGIESGDTVEITTTDGQFYEFVVTDVEEGALAGDNVRIAFIDIEKLAKRSWQEPQHPCGAGIPVGCSMPAVLNAIDNQVTQRFHAECVRHDYCYRHGYATYGIDRETCDEQFYDDMKTRCAPPGVLGILNPGGLMERAQCLTLAESMYRAVRRYGEPAFLTSASTNCPYDEPM